MVDDLILVFGSMCQEYFLDDFWQCGGVGFDCVGEWVVVEGMEVYYVFFDMGFFFVREMFEDVFVVDYDQCVVFFDNFVFGGEVQWDDWDVFQVDVLLDVQFGLVGQWEDVD